MAADMAMAGAMDRESDMVMTAALATEMAMATIFSI